MVVASSLEDRIVKQVEYYFGDINISRDKFMKEAIKENDGWIPMETMLKFNRLKSLSEDAQFIKDVLTKGSSFIEVGDLGLRRNPNMSLPENLDQAYESLKDRSIYVKGFVRDSSLDDIIEWLEQFGKTINVHMLRFPNDKKFKGSVFVTFEKKEDAENFLKSDDAANYNGQAMIRKYREDYLLKKKTEREERAAAKAKKKSVTTEKQDAQITAKMIAGCLLAISGLPMSTKKSEGEEAEVKEETKESDNDSEKTGGMALLDFKRWLSEKIGTHNPIAWVDIEPKLCKAVIRFKMPDGASVGWEKIKQSFGEKPVTYENCELEARVLSGEEERNHWKVVLAAQQSKSQKRRANRQHDQPNHGKRRRT